MSEQREVIIDYVSETPREFGENGAAVKVMLEGGAEAEYTSNREYAPKHIEALKKLVGKPTTMTGTQTQYGFKIEEYEGKPTGKGGGGQQRQGDWETFAEREFKDASIVSQVAAKLVMQAAAIEGATLEVAVAAVEQYAEEVAVAIRKAAKAVHAEGGYPQKVTSAQRQAPAPTGNGQVSLADRLRGVIEIAGGDAKGAIRAKSLLRAEAGHDDFTKLDEVQWANFLAKFQVAEDEAVLMAEAQAALTKDA